MRDLPSCSFKCLIDVFTALQSGAASTLWTNLQHLQGQQLCVQDGDKRILLAVFDSVLAQLASHLDRAVTAAKDKLKLLSVHIRTLGMQEVRIWCTVPIGIDPS